MMLLFTQISMVAQSTPSTMYVFAYSWTPGFCNGQTYPGCENSLNYWKQNFTIHGLWPQYITSGYPSTCTTEPFDPNIPINIGLDYMIERWPDVQYDVNTPHMIRSGSMNGLNMEPALDYPNMIILLLHYLSPIC